MTKSMAISLAPHITVNRLGLGSILPPADKPNEPVDHILAQSVLKRFCETGELEEALQFLLTGPTFITGEVIMLDGGRHLLWEPTQFQLLRWACKLFKLYVEDKLFCWRERITTIAQLTSTLLLGVCFIRHGTGTPQSAHLLHCHIPGTLTSCWIRQSTDFVFNAHCWTESTDDQFPPLPAEFKRFYHY